jgi:LemA protein
MKRLWAVLVAGVAVTLGGCGYNDIQRADEGVNAAWSEVVNQYQRRADLIPNLVETVKGYAEHERGTFEAVTQARANAQKAGSPGEVAAAEGILGQALGRLFAVAEAYPQLQADENFRQLQTELGETENRIAVSRQVYNDTVLTFNNAIQTFPGVLLAGPFGFTKREFFEVDDAAAREAPRVDFDRDAGAGTPAAPAPSGDPPAA